MSDERLSATGGFIQFGDGPEIPITDFTLTTPERPMSLAGEFLELRNLRDFSATVPIPPETAAALCRAVGLPQMADRIDIAAHPDLAELNVRMDGYYDES